MARKTTAATTTKATWTAATTALSYAHGSIEPPPTRSWWMIDQSTGGIGELGGRCPASLPLSGGHLSPRVQPCESRRRRQRQVSCVFGSVEPRVGVTEICLSPARATCLLLHVCGPELPRKTTTQTLSHHLLSQCQPHRALSSGGWSLAAGWPALNPERLSG